MSDIEKFADKYIDFFEHDFLRDPQSYNRFFENEEFPNDCRALGFEMDCGESFINAYGLTAWKDNLVLKESIERINDTTIIGAALFSQWRYYNHWAYSDATEETRQWFLILLYRLKDIEQKK